MKMITWVLIVGAFVVGGVVGFMFERQRATTKMEAYKMETQKMMDEARKMAAVSPSPSIAAEQFVMMKSDAKLGMIAADTKDMTLYTFDSDAQGKSNCYSSCAANWPPYLAAGTSPATLPAHLGTTKRTGGSLQYTWDGKPLYFYIKDKNPKDAFGDGVGGTWHVVK